MLYCHNLEGVEQGEIGETDESEMSASKDAQQKGDIPGAAQEEGV